MSPNYSFSLEETFATSTPIEGYCNDSNIGVYTADQVTAPKTQRNVKIEGYLSAS